MARRWRAVYLSGLILSGILLLWPMAAAAQDGPQFSGWGPGMTPPDQEGVDVGASPAQSGAPDSAIAPSTAPGANAPAPNAVAPNPVRGCPYDLRGYWRNDGRQTSSPFNSYSASVYVRQYRTWIQAQQNDGTSYYGQCIGNQLQFDVYNGYQFMGRQYGTITGFGPPVPVPYSGDAAAPSAAAAPPPPGGSNLRASFSWTTFYGSGTESWSRSAPPVIYSPGGGPVPMPAQSDEFAP